METILLAVTAVSLLVALIMSAAAWRMSREERARAAARIAALASAAASGDAPAEPIIAAPPAAPATLPAAMDELPLRPVFRVVETAAPSAFSAPSAPPALSAPPAPPALSALSAPSAPSAHPSYGQTGPDSYVVAPSGFLSGGELPTQSTGRQRGLMAAAAVLFVVLGTGAYWLISGDTLAGDAGTVAAAPAATAPLELISLRHERQGTKLSLSGLVRNPSAGAVVEGLNAVVFLFDAQGGFISSARVGVDFKRLSPGDESPFVVTMDAPSNVSRYRVSFRTDAGVVAHVDRRSEQPVATAIVR